MLYCHYSYSSGTCFFCWSSSLAFCCKSWDVLSSWLCSDVLAFCSSSSSWLCLQTHHTFKLISLKIKILFLFCTLVIHVYSRKINQMIFFLLYAKHLIIFWLGCTAVFVVVFFLLTTTESSCSGQWKSQNQQILLWITNFLLRYLLRFTSNLYSIFSLQTSVLCKVSMKTRSFSPHKMYLFFLPPSPSLTVGKF